MTKMTHPPEAQMALTGLKGGGVEIDWGYVQEAQRQAMVAGQEAMEQSRKGLMEVKEAILRRAQMQ